MAIIIYSERAMSFVGQDVYLCQVPVSLPELALKYSNLLNDKSLRGVTTGSYALAERFRRENELWIFLLFQNDLRAVAKAILLEEEPYVRVGICNVHPSVTALQMGSRLYRRYLSFLIEHSILAAVEQWAVDGCPLQIDLTFPYEIHNELVQLLSGIRVHAGRWVSLGGAGQLSYFCSL